MAFWAAVSAVVCAAYGVDFLAPRKPRPPALAHETVAPLISVIVTIVLLKVACTKTLPSKIDFFSFFFLVFAT
jgi:hypothetical protein